MGLIDRFRKQPTLPDDVFSPMPGFRVVYGDDTRFVADIETLRLMRDGLAQRAAQEQFFVLDCLAEQGLAVVGNDGFAVAAERIVRLDTDDAAVLGLPPRFQGQLRTKVHKWTASPDFRIELELQAGPYPVVPNRRGPVIWVAGSLLRLSVPLLETLRALDDHAALGAEARTETQNVRLVARLQAAQQLARASDDPGERDEHFELSLGALDRFSTVVPTHVGLTLERQDDGSLVVEPSLGARPDPALLSTRWHQIGHQHDDVPPGGEPINDTHRPGAAVIRAEDTLVLLEGSQLAGVEEVLTRPRIPADEVAQFLQAPGSYYDPELVEVDIGFSVRVAGLGVIAPVTFNLAASSGIDWFSTLKSVSGPGALATVATTSSEQEELENNVTRAWERGDDMIAVDQQVVDIGDHSLVEEALAASRRRIAGLGVEEAASDQIGPRDPGRRVVVGMHLLEAGPLPDQMRRRAAAAALRRPVDYSTLRRQPFPHQRAGIEWMTRLMQCALSTTDHDSARLQGALLADDMGLGKTYMILAALAEACVAPSAGDRERPPVLAVMPAALLENWLQELRATFSSEHGPFDDVAVLQGTGLDDYRIRGSARETSARIEDLDEHGMVFSDRIHATLRIGPAWGTARLDRPGILVLTTYETLRRYQVSLGLVEWGVVVLDEAQATKNPEILTTRAAKALKARFKLLATGTPVENSLRDFWSLVDTAQPGLLGTWSQFHDDWVTPMESAVPEEHQRLGHALRAAVGEFMLRRLKEDHLPDLPPKHIHEYPQVMPIVQSQRYDEVLLKHRRRVGEKGAALKTLHELAMVSLHPGLLDGGLSAGSHGVDDSARTLVTIRVILDTVRARNEKAIIFAKTKAMQRALALWLLDICGLRVDVVNGDTAATGRGSNTRLGKIRAFEERDGFNVIVMSPLAVGVGLNVVGANHAIHLERHWNPAKEAQATDRMHRIGQLRDVHVHYPVAMHPDTESFDVKLDRLLRTKTAIKDAVVVPQEVTQGELERALDLA